MRLKELNFSKRSEFGFFRKIDGLFEKKIFNFFEVVEGGKNAAQCDGKRKISPTFKNLGSAQKTDGFLEKNLGFFKNC